MKLRAATDKIELTVLSTSKEPMDFQFPKMNVHYWYPFNINFSYRFSDSKQMLYLVKEKGYTGENYYNVDILKRTKQLGYRNGVPFHPGVYKRNMYIIEKARDIGLPTVKDIYTAEDVEVAFNELGDIMQTLKDVAEERYCNDISGDLYIQFYPTEEYDEKVLGYLTEREQEVLHELGEIYSMLTVMRKLAEGR